MLVNKYVSTCAFNIIILWQQNQNYLVDIFKGIGMFISNNIFRLLLALILCTGIVLIYSCEAHKFADHKCILPNSKNESTDT